MYLYFPDTPPIFWVGVRSLCLSRVSWFYKLEDRPKIALCFIDFKYGFCASTVVITNYICTSTFDQRTDYWLDGAVVFPII